MKWNKDIKPITKLYYGMKIKLNDITDKSDWVFDWKHRKDKIYIYNYDGKDSLIELLYVNGKKSGWNCSPEFIQEHFYEVIE